MKTPADSDEFRCPECNIETAPGTFHICRTPKVIDILREQLKDYESALIRYENMALGHDENGKLNMVARAVLDKYGVKR